MAAHPLFAGVPTEPAVLPTTTTGPEVSCWGALEERVRTVVLELRVCTCKCGRLVHLATCAKEPKVTLVENPTLMVKSFWESLLLVPMAKVERGRLERTAQEETQEAQRRSMLFSVLRCVVCVKS